jgi:hypothetical protein
MSYDTGIVYKIICNLDSNFVYIGSTFNELRHRFQEHKNQYRFWINKKGNKCSCFDYFQKYGINNFSIIKIKEYICYRSHKLDKKHLHAYEQLWINKTRCCNKLPSFNPLRREKRKENDEKYRANNKEKIKEDQKEYYEKNKEQINEYQKEYYEKNKEKIKERIKEKNKEKIACDRCGIMVRKDGMNKHKKSNKCISFSN